MRVFVTGASGFVGSAVIEDLIRAGHTVLGLARSDAAVEALKRMEAEVHRGDLSDPKGLSLAALKCDGVIHAAYNHDFTQFAAAAEMDRRVVEALGEALSGTGRPLVITSAIGLLTPGQPTTEDDAGASKSPGAVRIPSEDTALALTSAGVRSSSLAIERFFSIGRVLYCSHRTPSMLALTGLVDERYQRWSRPSSGGATLRMCSSRCCIKSVSSLEVKGTNAPMAPMIVVYSRTSIPPGTRR